MALDLRGYGESDKPGRVEDYRLDTLVEDVHQLIPALGTGWGWGAGCPGGGGDGDSRGGSRNSLRGGGGSGPEFFEGGGGGGGVRVQVRGNFHILTKKKKSKPPKPPLWIRYWTGTEGGGGNGIIYSTLHTSIPV